MSPVAQKSIKLLERLIADQEHAAFDMIYSDFPPDGGPDEEYERKVAAEYDAIFGEISRALSQKHGPALVSPPAWAQMKAAGWLVAGEGVACVFLERDDWDTPLSLAVGYVDKSDYEGEDDPWSYERKEG